MLSVLGQSRFCPRVCPVQVHLLGALFLSRGHGQSRFCLRVCPDVCLRVCPVQK